jgi:hypothetical protein
MPTKSASHPLLREDGYEWVVWVICFGGIYIQVQELVMVSLIIASMGGFMIQLVRIGTDSSRMSLSTFTGKSPSQNVVILAGVVCSFWLGMTAIKYSTDGLTVGTYICIVLTAVFLDIFGLKAEQYEERQTQKSSVRT